MDFDSNPWSVGVDVRPMEFESKFLDWCLLGPGLGSVAVAVLDSKTNHMKYFCTDM